MTTAGSLAPVGCIRFPRGAAQGPLIWYRASLELAVEITQQTGAADLIAAVGPGAVVIASATGSDDSIVISSATIGDSFEAAETPIAGPGPVTVDFEISNYLQQASLNEREADVAIQFSEYGMDVESLTLRSGTIDVTEQPPYPISVVLGESTGDTIQVLVALRHPDRSAHELALVALNAEGGDRQPTIEPAGAQDMSEYVRPFTLRPNCSNGSVNCNIDLTASIGDDTVELRIAGNQGGQSDERNGYQTAALIVLGSLGLFIGGWLWITDRQA